MAWLDSDYTHRVSITKSAVAAALTNYPAPVDLRECGVALQNCRHDGRDLVFTDADGTTVLDFEMCRQQLFGGRGTLTWFNRPAVIYDSATDLIISGYVSPGSDGPGSGDQVVAAYDIVTH